MNPRDSVELMETQSCGLKGELDDGDKATDGKDTAEMDDDKTPGAYDCNICGRSFPFLSSLSQHMRRHTGARPYKCPYCDHRASQKGNLKVHIRSHKLGTLSSHHSNDDDDEEEEGGSTAAEVGVSEGLDGGTSPTKSSSACNRVIGGDGGSNSNAGEEGVKRKPPARSVKREKPASEQRPYCCRLCGYEAQREDQLLSHIEKVHITADADEESLANNNKEEAAAAPTTEAEPASSQPSQTDGTFPCETCGQVFTQAWFLKSHMKKHAGILEHCCHICGRRFREAWFLKSHMKTHSAKSKSARTRGTGEQSSEPAVTINDVAQDPDVSAGGVGVTASAYQICSKCGNLFHSRESLRLHEKVHGSSGSAAGGRRPPPSQRGRPGDDEDSPAAKRRLLDYLNLGAAPEVKPEEGDGGEEEKEKEKNSLGHRIPELDPVCSYQAWQLATRGRVVEPIEASYNNNKASSGDGGGGLGPEALAGASVVYEKESSRYVLKGQEQRRSSDRRRRSHSSHAGSSGGDRTPESLSDSEYRPASRQDHRRHPRTSQTQQTSSSSSSSKSSSNECFECGKVFRSRHQMIVHQRVHRKEGKGLPSSGGEKERGGAGRGGGDRWGSTSEPESGSPSRPSTPGYGDSPPESVSLGNEASEMDTAEAAGQVAANCNDEKPYVCSLCDFVATESSAYLSHVRVAHPATTQDGGGSGRPRPSPAPSPSPSPSSSAGSDRGGNNPGFSYPKLKMALLQGSPNPAAVAAPHPYLTPRASSVDKPPSQSSSPSSSSDPSLTPLDLCVKAEVPRGSSSSPVAPVDKKGLPSHKCSFCSYSSRYPEVLWMHQTVSHRINSSSSSLAPKWALKNGLKRPRDGSHASRRRTGPPPVLEGKECPPLPPVVRTPRTQPPATAYSPPGETPKKNGGKPVAAGHPSNSSSSSSSTPSSRGSSFSSGPQAARHAVRPGSSSSRPPGDHHHPSSNSRPRVDLYPRGGSSGSSSSPAGSLEKSMGIVSSSSSQRPSAAAPPPPTSSSSSSGGRLADRYAMHPQEGLGFMLSSKHGLAEYSRARSSPQPSRIPHHQHQQHHHHQPQHQQHQPHHANNNSHSIQAVRAAAGQGQSRPSTITHSSSSMGHGYGGTSQTHGGALQNSSTSLQNSSSSSSSSSLSSGGGGTRGADVVKREAITQEGHEMPVDVLGFLKNYSPHELAALYHRWGAAHNAALLDPTGMLRSLMRQGQYVCHECGKSFSQPSHLRTHMRSHTGERPFCCRLCPYRASQKGNLKTHVQSVHHLPFDNDQYPESCGTLLSLGPPEQEGDWTPQQQPPPQHTAADTCINGRSSGAECGIAASRGSHSHTAQQHQQQHQQHH